MRRPRSARALLTIVALAVGLVLVACGDDGDDEDTSATTTTEAATDPATQPDGSTTTGATTSEPDGSTTTSAPGELPGEAIDIYPYADAHLGVVGVAADDTLNVRSGPGTDYEVVAELNPLSQEPTATGHNRAFEEALWVEVSIDGTVGWVNGAFVAQPGAVVDITADVPDTSAATMAELAEAVAATRVFEGEGPTPTVTIVAGPSDTEVTVDVLGLADDAQKGERLLITAGPGGSGVTVVGVESIALCARGVTDDGLCT